MRSLCALAVVVSFIGTSALGGVAPPLGPHPLTPGDAGDLLRAGSERVALGQPRNAVAERALMPIAAGVRPLAAVLGCIDPGVRIEGAFDRRAGEVVGVRVVAHAAGPQSIASLEHAASELGVPVIVVLGHEGCRLGGCAHGADDRSLAVTRVATTIERLLRTSPALAERAASGQLDILGALQTPVGIEWLGRHAQQDDLARAAMREAREAAESAEPPQEPAAGQPGPSPKAAHAQADREAAPEPRADEPGGRIVIRNGRAVRVFD
ncbi:MAG: carbonic anhydrase [Planctomycetota bacterium]